MREYHVGRPIFPHTKSQVKRFMFLSQCTKMHHYSPWGDTTHAWAVSHRVNRCVLSACLDNAHRMITSKDSPVAVNRGQELMKPITELWTLFFYSFFLLQECAV